MISNSQYLVLITDISTRKSFDLANILMHKKIDILLSDTLNTIDTTILSAAYGKEIELLRKDAHFASDLCKILEKYSDYKIIYIPIEEDTTVLVYQFLKKYTFENFYHNLPLENMFDIVRDKGKFSLFCTEERLAIPPEYHLENLLSMDQLPCKLILKPKSGSGSVGIRFIDTKADLASCLDLNMSDYVIQERLENPKDVKGGFFLYDQGKIVSYYGHQRIRTYPESGGVSIYSKSDMNPVLKTLGNELLEKLAWSGIAMVEFLYDSNTKSYKIIEVNPRLWGSLMLSEFCGSEMVENYCLIALGLPIKESNIKKDTFIRWIFPWDLLHYMQHKAKTKDFWKFDREDTCYINFTYSTYTRSILFTIYNMINPKKVQRLLQKVFQ